MTPTETLKILNGLMQTFPIQSRKFTAAEINAMNKQWSLLLAGFPPRLVQAAALQVAAGSTFFPKVGEIREQIMNIIALAEGLPTANDAWQEVSGRLSRGFYEKKFPDDPQSLCFKKRKPTADDWSHPLVQQAIDGIGGWRQLTHKTSIPGVDRANFIKCYEILIQRHRQDQSLLPGVRNVVQQLRAGGGGLLGIGDVVRLLGE